MKSPPTAEPIAYLNGAFLPFGAARLPVYDLGIVQGAAVSERLRTVRHAPYLLREHLDRLERSLEKVGFRNPEDAAAEGPFPTMNDLESIVDVIARTNAALIPVETDLSIVLFVTAGLALGDANGLASISRPSLCVYSSPLPNRAWRRRYVEGVHLVTPRIRHLPPECLDPSIKMRSRLNWYLADREAAGAAPDATALLLDRDGLVTETGTGNLFVVRSGELLTPRAETTLPGISQAHVIRLAAGQGWAVRREGLTPEAVASADEAFLTSSTYCIMPVTRLNHQPIGAGRPGPVTRRLTHLWNEELGLDFTRSG